MRRGEFRNLSRHLSHMSAATTEVSRALGINRATCPAEEWGWAPGGGKLGSGKLEMEQGRLAPFAKCLTGLTPSSRCHFKAHYPPC